MSDGNILYKLSSDEQEFDVESGTEVTDYVFINSSGKAEKADASDINKMPAIGRVTRIVGNKCFVKKDLIETEYSSVTPRTWFYISPDNAGEITDIEPTGEGVVKQPIGFGLDEDKILIRIDISNIVIRS